GGSTGGGWSWGGGRTRGSDRDSGKGGGAIVLILIAIAIFIIARFLAIALRFAVSRKREYLADAGSVELTKNPDAMISALKKIAGHSEIEAPASIQEMFLDMPASGLFATHPTIERRIERLIEYAGGRELPVSVEAARAPLPEEAAAAPDQGAAPASFGRRKGPPEAAAGEATPQPGPWG